MMARRPSDLKDPELMTKEFYLEAKGGTRAKYKLVTHNILVSTPVSVVLVSVPERKRSR